MATLHWREPRDPREEPVTIEKLVEDDDELDEDDADRFADWDDERAS